MTSSGDQRVTDMRTDFLQKLSTQLIHKNQVIMVETLGTKNLLKNRRLARAISDAGFGEFVGMLEYKSSSGAAWLGQEEIHGEGRRNRWQYPQFRGVAWAPLVA